MPILLVFLFRILSAASTCLELSLHSSSITRIMLYISIVHLRKLSWHYIPSPQSQSTTTLDLFFSFTHLVRS